MGEFRIPVNSSWYTKELRYIEVIDANTALVVGYFLVQFPDVYNGVILKTVNGGANWSTQYHGWYHEVRSISAIDANNAWEVGGSYTGALILKNTDGTNWSNQPPDSYKLKGVSAVDAKTVYEVGAEGEISKSVNGGANCLLQDKLGPGNWLYSVLAFDKDNVWAVGLSGIILHTDDGGDSLSVLSITPGTGAQNTVVRACKIDGTGFEPGPSVWLKRGTLVIDATEVQAVTPMKITCTFDFMGAFVGVYDLLVRNASGEEAVLPAGFPVVTPPFQCGKGTGFSMLFFGAVCGLLFLGAHPLIRKQFFRSKES